MIVIFNEASPGTLQAYLREDWAVRSEQDPINGAGFFFLFYLPRLTDVIGSSLHVQVNSITITERERGSSKSVSLDH